MPKLTKEITGGSEFSRSMESGAIADAQTRRFRVLLSQPGETFNIQQECGVYIGDQHPYNTNIYCRSFSSAFEGDSRMVLICTFQYASRPQSDSANEDPGSYSPDVRPANWSISTSLMEAPAMSWREDGTLIWKPPQNPVGDIYDGVTKVVPVTTIAIEQWEANDPTKHCEHCGKVNSALFRVGSLNCEKRTVMFRGLSARPAIESWGQNIYRGWQITYEFAYRPNFGTWYQHDSPEEVGWDILIPQSGFNVKAFAVPGGGDRQDYGQPLKHNAGKIADPLALPDNINAGDKVRGMVKVHEYENGGASQLPSAQPIPLNDDGSPRIDTADPKVIVRRYQVQEVMDFATLQLRLT